MFPLVALSQKPPQNPCRTIAVLRSFCYSWDMNETKPAEPMTITLLRRRIDRLTPGPKRSKLIADLRRWQRSPAALDRPGFGK